MSETVKVAPRELEALVAEHVFHWSLLKDREYGTPPPTRMVLMVPPYCGSFDAAFDVVERMQTEGRTCGIDNHGGKWGVLFIDDSVEGLAHHSDLRVAINLAALRAKGIEVALQVAPEAGDTEAEP